MENVKQTNGQLNVETAKVLTSPVAVYEGFGTHDLNGNVIYNISLPKEADGNVHIQKIIELPKNVLFIWVHAGPKEYENPTSNMITLHFNMNNHMTPAPVIKETYTIHFYHNNTISVANVTANVKQIILDRCGVSYKSHKERFVVPEGCGNGVLTLK